MRDLKLMDIFRASFFICAFGVLTIATAPSLARTEESPPTTLTAESIQNKSLIRFAAIVQFTNGGVARVDAQRARTPLKFQSTLHEGERFATDAGATLKFVARSECTAVVYGESQGQTPNMELPWRLNAESARWICPPSTRETVLIGEDRFEIEGGEFLIDKTRLLVLRGRVAVGSGAEAALELPTQKLLTRQTDGWKETQTEVSSSLAIWEFNRSLKPPAESTDLPEPERPPAIKNTRVILGPMGGGGGTHFDNKEIDSDDLGGNGARLQVQRKFGRGSLLASISYLDLEKDSQKNQVGVTPPDGIYSRASVFSVEAGYRMYHEKWWSPYARGGLGVAKAKVNIQAFQSANYGSNIEYEFYVATVAAGMDLYYSPRRLSWFGVYTGAEIHLPTSFAKAGRTVNHESTSGTKPKSADEPGSLTTTALQLIFGLMILF